MKYTIFFLILLISGCATSDITLNSHALKPVKIITIVPFTSEVSLKKEILREAEDYFKTAFVKMGYKISESDKLNQAMEKDNLSVFTTDNVKRIGKLTGADAVLFGEITEHNEVTKEDMFYIGSFMSGVLYNKSHEEMKYVTRYTFRIVIRLADVSDGSVILAMNNRYKEIKQEENLQCCSSLDAYRKYTLKKLTDELIETIKEKD
jgi:curli biogenesis system outer membrane secretion channel CsgG